MVPNYTKTVDMLQGIFNKIKGDLFKDQCIGNVELVFENDKKLFEEHVTVEGKKSRTMAYIDHRNGLHSSVSFIHLLITDYKEMTSEKYKDLQAVLVHELCHSLPSVRYFFKEYSYFDEYKKIYEDIFGPNKQNKEYNYSNFDKIFTHSHEFFLQCFKRYKKIFNKEELDNVFKKEGWDMNYESYVAEEVIKKYIENDLVHKNILNGDQDTLIFTSKDYKMASYKVYN